MGIPSRADEWRDRPSIRCKDVSKSYGAVCALSDVNLTVSNEGITAIVGPNGAGKSTLIDVVTGFTLPSAGRLYFSGVEITGRRPEHIAQLGMVRTFQELRLVREMDVIENVLLAFPGQMGETFTGAILGRSKGLEARENILIAEAMLGRCELLDLAAEKAGNLSYGQQKLLTVACCIATGSRFLLFDEPVAGVSPGMVDRILKLFLELEREGHGIVIVEHDLEAVRRVARRVVVMAGGRVVAQGSPEVTLDSREVMEVYLD